MRQLIFSLAAILMLSAIGCAHNQSNSCNNNGLRHSGLRGHHGHHGGHGLLANPGKVPKIPHGAIQEGPAGPPTGAYAYPYYTLRGPRDYFVDNPPTIGP